MVYEWIIECIDTICVKYYFCLPFCNKLPSREQENQLLITIITMNLIIILQAINLVVFLHGNFLHYN